MVRTRAVPRRMPNVNVCGRQRPNDNFEQRRVRSTTGNTATGNKELGRRIRVSDVKIKFVLPRVKDVEVKVRGNVVRKMKVRRVAKHGAKKRNVRYG